MKEKENTQAPQKQSRKRGEDQLDVLFRFARYLENLPTWFPSLPEELQKELNTLIASCWKKFDETRSAKKESVLATKQHN